MYVITVLSWLVWLEVFHIYFVKKKFSSPETMKLAGTEVIYDGCKYDNERNQMHGDERIKRTN